MDEEASSHLRAGICCIYRDCFVFVFLFFSWD